MLENNQKELILLKDLGMLYPTEKSSQKTRFGLYKCFCGNEFKSSFQDIKSNHTKSCGCLRGKNHNLSNHRLYNTWLGMIKRCNFKSHSYYSQYGARGITVCDEWLDIKNFINDMYPSFQEGLTIDRIDNNKGYFKDNCRWANKKVQQRNQRRLRSTNTSGYRGVSWFARDGKWKTQIRVNYKTIHIGTFSTAIEAARAYDNYIINNNLEHTRNFS
jgi:hypothetical protein